MNKIKLKFKVINLVSIFLLFSTISLYLLSNPKKVNAFFGADWLIAAFTGKSSIENTITVGTTGATAGAAATDAGTNVVHTSLTFEQKVENAAKEVLKQSIILAEKKFLNEITTGTVKWINSGFSGSPLFVQNPESFFKDIGKFEIKNIVNTYGYDTNRFPFGESYALNVINSYKNTLANNAQYSLSNAIRDPIVLNNYRNNFNFGGWSGFITNTQYPQNNYIGFNMMATDQLAQKLNGTVMNNAQKVQDVLKKGQGFLSPQICPGNSPNAQAYNSKIANEFNRPTFHDTLNPKNYTADPIEKKDSNGNVILDDNGDPIIENEAYLDQLSKKWQDDFAKEKTTWEESNTCKAGLVATTPGFVVANQITNALGSDFRKSELGAALGSSIAAILDSLSNNLFNKGGLNSLVSNTNPPPNNVDNFDYKGNTLGSPATIINGNYNSEPDRPIILDDFKTQVQKDIDNTNMEIDLMNNDDKNNLGIKQILDQIGVQTQKIDCVTPSTDINILSNKSEITNQLSNELTKKAVIGKLNTIKNGLKSITKQPDPGSDEEKVLINLQKIYDSISLNISSTDSINTTQNYLSKIKEKLNTLNNTKKTCDKTNTEIGTCTYINGITDTNTTKNACEDYNGTWEINILSHEKTGICDFTTSGISSNGVWITDTNLTTSNPLGSCTDVHGTRENITKTACGDAQWTPNQTPPPSGSSASGTGLVN